MKRITAFVLITLAFTASGVFAADGLYGDFTDNNKVDMNDLPDFLDSGW